jgi:hypothetical protein
MKGIDKEDRLMKRGGSLFKTNYSEKPVLTIGIRGRIEKKQKKGGMCNEQ